MESHIDSEYQKASTYLRQLQQRVYNKLGVKPTHILLSDRQKEIDEQLANEMVRVQGIPPGWTIDESRKHSSATLEQMRIQNPHPLEDPNWHFVLKDLTSSIENTMTKLSMPYPNKYLFGSLPLGQVNAMVVSVPSSSYVLILFNDGLFGYANLISKVFATAFAPKFTDHVLEWNNSKEDCEKEIISNKSVFERFDDILIAYLVKGHPHNAKPYMPDREVSILATFFRESIEVFVLSHELGHVIAGHLNNAEKHNTLLRGIKVQEINYNWENELEADAHALTITAATMENRGSARSTSLCGINILFLSMEAIERGLQILSTGKYKKIIDVSSSHPPSYVRQQSLKNVLKKIVGDLNSERMLDMSNISDFIFDIMWSRTETTLLNIFNKGIKPSSYWQ
jgi:hypothetical protein